jgi:hypothetical protein
MFTPPAHNIGGHMPHPPETCLKKEFWRLYNSITWIDLSICHNCQDIKICQQRREYLTYLKQVKTPINQGEQND